MCVSGPQVKTVSSLGKSRAWSWVSRSWAVPMVIHVPLESMSHAECMRLFRAAGIFSSSCLGCPAHLQDCKHAHPSCCILSLLCLEYGFWVRSEVGPGLAFFCDWQAHRHSVLSCKPPDVTRAPTTPDPACGRLPHQVSLQKFLEKCVFPSPKKKQLRNTDHGGKGSGSSVVCPACKPSFILLPTPQGRHPSLLWGHQCFHRSGAGRPARPRSLPLTQLCTDAAQSLVSRRLWGSLFPVPQGALGGTRRCHHHSLRPPIGLA